METEIILSEKQKMQLFIAYKAYKFGAIDYHKFLSICSKIGILFTTCFVHLLDGKVIAIESSILSLIGKF